MKNIFVSSLLAILFVAYLTSCDDKKAEKSEDALAVLIKDAANKKASENEELKAAKQAKADRKAAREEARLAREEAEAARMEAEEAREEAQRAREEAARARRNTPVRANIAIPGARYAHVIREGGYTNARSGPGTGYSVMNKVKDGSPILYTGNIGYAWVEVYTLDGMYLGYMSSNKVIPD